MAFTMMHMLCNNLRPFAGSPLKRSSSTPVLRRFVLVFCIAFSSSSVLQAADLMDIFRSARNHYPAWTAQQLKFQAEKEKVNAVEALLYPNIIASASASDIHTSGSGIAMVNPVYLEEGPLLDCFRDSYNNRACDPPLVIRDDLGGRYDTFDASIQVVQPLYNYKLWRGYNQAKLLDNKTEAGFEKAKQDFILRVAEAYFAVLRAHEQWELSQSETQAAETQLEQAKRGYQLGLLPQGDVYAIRAATDASKVQLLIAKTALESAQENLMLMTQRRDVSLATLSNRMLIEPPQPQNAEEWVKMGLRYNRSLQEAHSATLAAEQELAVRRGGFHPELDLIAGYTMSRNDRVAIETAPSVRKSGIGVRLRYPIYQGGRTTAEVKAASLALDGAGQMFEQTRRDVIRDIRNAYRQVYNAVRGVEAAALSVHSNEKALEVAQAGYENGTRSLTDVLITQADVFRARKNHADARYHFITHSLRLKYSAGTLKIEDLQIVNSWLNPDKLILPPEENNEIPQENLFY